jgi:hypothetical protein
MLGLFAKALFVLDGIGHSPGARRLLSKFNLESWLLGGLIVFVSGVSIDGRILGRWLATRGGELDAAVTHLAILGGTLAVVGLQIVFSSFFLSILKASRTGRWV